MADGRSRPSVESLSTLAARVDEVLALYGYELTPAIEAIDAAVSGHGGLFAPRTDDSRRRAAVDEVLAAGPPPGYPTTDPAVSSVVVYVDGSARRNPGPAGAGAALRTAAGAVTYLGRPVGSHTTNNVAEYAALELGLDQARTRFGPAAVEVRIDSMTVVDDIWGGGENTTSTETYRQAIETHLSAVRTHDWTHLTDSEQNPADARATVGADIAALGP